MKLVLALALIAQGLLLSGCYGVYGHDEMEGTHAYVRYHDVRIPKDHILGDRGEGFAVAQTRLGGGRIAYVRPIRSEEVHALFPQVPEIAPGLTLFALLSADGTPIMLTDSREAAVANAWSQELEAVSVH